ncbi:MAG: hypothetical protein KH452_06255 [Clostridiales bacterium]|nr:hypothetical protein [Clostridiales bacterium]
MTFDELRTEIKAANLVLVGIGEDLHGDMDGFYRSLAGLLDKKDYFVVTLQDREGLVQAGIFGEQITAPFSEGEPQESWDKYLHWLSFTLHQKLCVLELGVGFLKPEVIRFPFEKTSYFNQKSRYIRINETFPQLSAEIADRGISIKENPVDFLTES